MTKKMTKVWPINDRRVVREDENYLTIGEACALDDMIDTHTFVWEDEPEQERRCGSCGGDLPKGFIHTYQCRSLYPIWPE